MPRRYPEPISPPIFTFQLQQWTPLSSRIGKGTRVRRRMPFALAPRDGMMVVANLTTHEKTSIKDLSHTNAPTIANSNAAPLSTSIVLSSPTPTQLGSTSVQLGEFMVYTVDRASSGMDVTPTIQPPCGTASPKAIHSSSWMSRADVSQSLSLVSLFCLCFLFSYISHQL